MKMALLRFHATLSDILSYMAKMKIRAQNVLSSLTLFSVKHEILLYSRSKILFEQDPSIQSVIEISFSEKDADTVTTLLDWTIHNPSPL